MRKYQSCRNMPLDMRNRFVPLHNTQDEVLDKEAKNYKVKRNITTPSSNTSI